MTGSFLSDSGDAKPGPFSRSFQGNHVSFTRESGGRVYEYAAELNSPVRMRGSMVVAGISCSFTASKG